jgi:hypothetical protein
VLNPPKPALTGTNMPHDAGREPDGFAGVLRQIKARQ